MTIGSPPAKRWPRGQKFALSPVGAAAESGYRTAVQAARASGRTALDTALAAWAAPHGLAPADGVVLCELSGKRLGLADICASLESAGIVPEEVRAAIARLVAAGIVEPLPMPSRDARA